MTNIVQIVLMEYYFNVFVTIYFIESVLGIQTEYFWVTFDPFKSDYYF